MHWEWLWNPFVWLPLSFVVFGGLSLYRPNVPGQRLIRKGMATDLLYYLSPLLLGRIQGIFIVSGLMLWFGVQNDAAVHRIATFGYPPLNQLPMWAQVGLYLLGYDMIAYWWHRGFHSRQGWLYHAVHHSSPVVDWLSAPRFHPVETIVRVYGTNAVLLLMGFNPAVLMLTVPFNLFMNGLVHANLSFDFGPFKYLIASPVFHRWHHTMPEEGGNKNFAPTFPFLDVLFGTFYMPKGKLPEHFGVQDNPPPEDFLGQLVYPFREGRAGLEK